VEPTPPPSVIENLPLSPPSADSSNEEKMAKVIVVSRQKPISRENKQEWQNEKRAKELHRRGYGVGNIEAMMYTKQNPISVGKIEKMIKKERGPRDMVIDGRLS